MLKYDVCHSQSLGPLPETVEDSRSRKSNVPSIKVCFISSHLTSMTIAFKRIQKYPSTAERRAHEQTLLLSPPSDFCNETRVRQARSRMRSQNIIPKANKCLFLMCSHALFNGFQGKRRGYGLRNAYTMYFRPKLLMTLEIGRIHWSLTQVIKLMRSKYCIYV